MSVDPNAEAQQSMRARYEELAELAGSLAHEIKNPLSVIHMNIDLLSEDLLEINSPISRRSLDRVDIVRSQCERMEGLLRDFLRYTRLTNIDLVSGSLNEQVEMVLRAYQAQANADHIDIEKYLDADLPAIKLHSDSLQAALMNLVKNALEATSRGGQLIARTYSTQASVALDLIDTGQALMRARRGRDQSQLIRHGGIKRIIDQRTLAAAGHPAHADQQAQWDINIHVLQVVRRCATQLNQT